MNFANSTKNHKKQSNESKNKVEEEVLKVAFTKLQDILDSEYMDSRATRHIIISKEFLEFIESLGYRKQLVTTTRPEKHKIKGV